MNGKQLRNPTHYIGFVGKPVCIWCFLLVQCGCIIGGLAGAECIIRTAMAQLSVRRVRPAVGPARVIAVPDIGGSFVEMEISSRKA